MPGVGSACPDGIWPLLKVNEMEEVGRFWREIFCCAGHRWWLVQDEEEGGWFISKLLLLFVGELKRFSLPFQDENTPNPSFPGHWSLKDPLLFSVAVLRFPAGFLCLLHLSRWAGRAERCDCRAGREMSRQPLSSSLMPVQVRNVFIAECTVCVCAHVCLGKFQRQRIMHLNYTPVWSYSPAQELKSCKESTEVTNTIWFF